MRTSELTAVDIPIHTGHHFIGRNSIGHGRIGHNYLGRQVAMRTSELTAARAELQGLQFDNESLRKGLDALMAMNRGTAAPSASPLPSVGGSVPSPSPAMPARAPESMAGGYSFHIHTGHNFIGHNFIGHNYICHKPFAR